MINPENIFRYQANSGADGGGGGDEAGNTDVTTIKIDQNSLCPPETQSSGLGDVTKPLPVPPGYTTMT